MPTQLCDFDVTDEQMRAAASVKWTYAPPHVIPAWVAELDVLPCPAVLLAVQDAVTRGAFGYASFDAVVEVSVGLDFGTGLNRNARINIGTSVEHLTRVMERLGTAWGRGRTV